MAAQSTKKSIWEENDWKVILTHMLIIEYSSEADKTRDEFKQLKLQYI